MADEIKEQETVETKVDETVEQKPEDKPFGFKIPEVVSKIINKIKGSGSKTNSALDITEEKIDESKESGETKELDKQTSEKVESSVSKSSDDETIEEEIPYHLVQAARELGWSDATIVKLAETDISVLEDVYKKSEPKKEVEKEKPTETSKIVIEDAVLKKWREDFGDDAVDKVIKPLLDAQNKLSEQVNTLQSGITEQDKQTKVSQLVQVFNNFNSTLDKLSDKYPEFGTYEKMPKRQDGNPLPNSPEYKIRSKVYDTTMMFIKNGYPEHKAIEEAVNWYSGTQGDKRAERKIVEEINNQTKKFSPKPSAKKGNKTYRTVDEKKTAIIAEAKESAGIK